DLPCLGKRFVLPGPWGLLLCGGECRLSIATLDLNDRQRVVIGIRTGLQLNRAADRPLGLIEPVEPREISGEPVIPVGPQRLGGECLPGELDRPLQLTESGELTPEGELRIAVVGREFRRTAKLRFRPAPVEIGALKHIPPGKMCSRKLGRET